MAKTNTTVIAEHEIRLNQIEGLLPDMALGIKSINSKLDEKYVKQKDYEKHLEEQTKHNEEVEKQLKEIKKTMMTQDDFRSFSRSQLFQKVMSGLGGIGITVITALIIWALTQ